MVNTVNSNDDTYYLKGGKRNEFHIVKRKYLVVSQLSQTYSSFNTYLGSRRAMETPALINAKLIEMGS